MYNQMGQNKFSDPFLNTNPEVFKNLKIYVDQNLDIHQQSLID